MLISFRKCDHCGKELNEMKDYIEIELDRYGLVVVDLCVDCYSELQERINQFCGRDKHDIL